jgi:uncharacterized protein YhaN
MENQESCCVSQKQEERDKESKLLKDIQSHVFFTGCDMRNSYKESLKGIEKLPELKLLSSENKDKLVSLSQELKTLGQAYCDKLQEYLDSLDKNILRIKLDL